MFHWFCKDFPWTSVFFLRFCKEFRWEQSFFCNCIAVFVAPRAGPKERSRKKKQKNEKQQKSMCLWGEGPDFQLKTHKTKHLKFLCCFVSLLFLFDDRSLGPALGASKIIQVMIFWMMFIENIGLPKVSKGCSLKRFYLGFVRICDCSLGSALTFVLIDKRCNN